MNFSQTRSSARPFFQHLIRSSAITFFSLSSAAALGQNLLPGVPKFVAISSVVLRADSYSSFSLPEDSASALPEAPAPQRNATGQPLPPAGINDREALARRSAGVIHAGQRGDKLTVRDKEYMGLAELINPEGLAAMLLSSGYEQAFNSLPNYGTDKGAYGERLGAAAVREESQSVFTYMVFSPLLHEDSRYYVEGPSFNAIHRTLFAITRPLITRRDDGRKTLNGALLFGYAASAALTSAYYPSSNRNFHDVLSVYGGSLGGSALGFFVNEFTDDALIFVHLKHRSQ